MKITTDWSQLLGPYQTVVADPPWPYTSAGPVGVGGRASKSFIRDNPTPSSVDRYGSMTIKELCQLPVRNRTTLNAHLYLWVTNSFLKDCYEIAESWGFTPKTLLTWGKVKSDLLRTPSMKTGYYFRGATEHILFAVKGSLPLQSDKAYPTLFFKRQVASLSKATLVL